MDDRIRDAKPPARRRLSAEAVARALVQGLFLLAGLAATVLGFGLFLEANDVVNAHRTAPVCGTAAHTSGTDCVLRRTGKVTAKDSTVGEISKYTLTVARETAPGHDYSVSSNLYDAVEVGVDVEMTVYRGRVAEMSYNGTSAQFPGRLWQTAFKVSFLAGLGSALTVFGLTWSREGADALPFANGSALFIAPMTYFGFNMLVPTQLSLTAILAAPVVGWLILTLFCTAAAWLDD
ncbi:hypothetical protein ACWEQL_31690 [Kitasatospora sp. NPDC004240]